MHVLILYNAPTLDAGHPEAEAEHEVLGTANTVQDELRRAAGRRFRVTSLGINADPQPLLDALRHDRPDVVFNLFEGTAGEPMAEAYVLGLLEWSRVPFTGCPMQAAVLARDKPRAKQLLQGAGLSTPRWALYHDARTTGIDLRWPVIAKPAGEDASIGIDQESVAVGPEQLRARVEFLLHRFGPPVLVEEFIEGREFNVGVIENPELRVLSIAEIQFTGQAQGLWPIVTYESKWRPGSVEDLATPPICPAEVDLRLADRLRAIAAEAFRLFACRDYARIDLRVNPQGEPFVLEVNPNPAYNPSSGLTQALTASGISHEEFTVQLVRQAAERCARASLK